MARETLPAYQFHYLANISKYIKILWGLILLMALSNKAASQAIVKNLPGFSEELPFRLETGYIGVGELDEVQLFYYFIQSEGLPADDPLVLWLTGGPGCSGLSALMYEIADRRMLSDKVGLPLGLSFFEGIACPIGFDYKKSGGGHKPVLVLKDYSWTKAANIIFLDAPVGTGFSYATTSEGYNTSDTKSTAQTYEFLRKWLLAHPKFLTNPVYIGGDSYSGITVPAIVKKILDGNQDGTIPAINLKGYVLGNPFTDVKFDVNSRVKFAHRVGLLSDELYEATKLDCHGEYEHPNKSDAACIEHLEIVNLFLKDINKHMILEPKCLLSPKPDTLVWDSSSVGVSVSDALLSEANPIEPWCRSFNYLFVDIWANYKEVQEALHVRNGTIKEWEMCNKSLPSSYVYDILSSLEYHRNFTSTDLRALVYSGDHDLIIPHVGTREWIQSLNLTVSANYEWRPWFGSGQIEGYTEIYSGKEYSITFTTVKGAGHIAPEYKPNECFDMINRWLAYYFL